MYLIPYLEISRASQEHLRDRQDLLKLDLNRQEHQGPQEADRKGKTSLHQRRRGEHPKHVEPLSHQKAHPSQLALPPSTQRDAETPPRETRALQFRDQPW